MCGVSQPSLESLGKDFVHISSSVNSFSKLVKVVKTPNAVLNAICEVVESACLCRTRFEREELGLHVDLAEAGDAAGELEERLHTFENVHVCEADFL